jgi:hypothetical protein
MNFHSHPPTFYMSMMMHRLAAMAPLQRIPNEQEGKNPPGDKVLADGIY